MNPSNQHPSTADPTPPELDAPCPPSTYRHYIGHVYLSGGHINVDIGARKVVNDRSVEISRQRVRDRETRNVEVTPEVAAHLVEVFGAIDSWEELRALLRLLRDAAAYDGGADAA